MSQMGAVLGCGLIDAAGRNVTISLFNAHNNCKRQSAIIGMAIFWQYWYWYPLIPFITLCFEPTMIMALNRELQMVKLSVESREKNKARFDYVENLKEEKQDKRKKAIKVELSIAAKTKQRKQQKEKEKEKEDGNGDDDDDDMEMKEEVISSNTKMEVDDDENDKGDDEENENGKENKDDDGKSADKKEESKYNVLENPSRVTPNQVKYVQWVDTRYKPLTARFRGFVMVQDTKPDLETELVEQKEIASGGVYGDEPDPPEPFLFLRD